jgi:hypothetical protein
MDTPITGCGCGIPLGQLGGDNVYYTGPNLPHVGIITNETLNSIVQKMSNIALSAYTDEQAQDAIGSILVPTSSIVLTYTDPTPASISATIVDSYVLSLVNANPSGSYIQNQTAVAQVASARVSGNISAGSLTATTSSITPASRATDPIASNGSLVYRSDLNKLRANINAVWKNVAIEQDISRTGRTIYVDANSPNATDVRTGLLSTSFQFPYKTIQAAATEIAVVGAHNGAYKIHVMAGIYTENITTTSALYLELAAGVSIIGSLTVGDSLTLIGAASLNTTPNTGGFYYALSTIISNSSVATIRCGTNRTSPSPRLVIQDMYIENNGTGMGIWDTCGTTLIRCTVFSGSGIAVQYDAYVHGIYDNCVIKSTGNTALLSLMSLTAKNSTIVSLGSAPTHHAIHVYATSSYFVERCNLYSAAGRGIFGDSWGGTVAVRDCKINSFLEAIRSVTPTNAVSDDGTCEVVNNVMNVRDPSIVDTFYITMSANATIPTAPPMVLGNRYNRLKYHVDINGLIVTADGNVPSLPMGPNFPRMAFTSPNVSTREEIWGGSYVEQTIKIAYYVAGVYNIYLTQFEIMVVDNMVNANATLNDISNYLSGLGYGVILLSGL